MSLHRFAVLASALLCVSAVAAAPALRRATVWDLKLGEPIAAQPAPEEYRGFACGSNGGPPRQSLTGWRDFARCRAEPGGLHEVYFEYDDELEYIARAKDIDREITRWAGTTEIRFPLIVSALFDDAGILKGIRLITDSRPEHRNEITEADLKTREDAYQFGGIMAGRFNIEAERDCKTLPPAEGENEVGDPVHQTRLREDGRGRASQIRAARESLSQARPERRQSATPHAVDAGAVRELVAAGDLRQRVAIAPDGALTPPAPCHPA